MSLRLVVEYAVELNKISNNPEEIIEKVQSVCERATVYGVAGTLKFLKMGGRIPKSLATIGEVL
ncbi:DegV family protein [Facklamia sp. DSM 111018]|uniref:DegV family protein n=1 Tax=Facklamia lactis TaxID=2749967 RepID=A0ABS0LNY1_9LACT|nr:DegV family protein [Facklamia lactis]